MSGCCDPCVVTSPDLSSTADHALDPPASSPLIFGKCKFLTLWKYISRLNLFVVNEKTNNFGSQRMAKVGSESPELNFIRLNCLPLTLYIILHTDCVKKWRWYLSPRRQIEFCNNAPILGAKGNFPTKPIQIWKIRGNSVKMRDGNVPYIQKLSLEAVAPPNAQIADMTESVDWLFSFI